MCECVLYNWCLAFKQLRARSVSDGVWAFKPMLLLGLFQSVSPMKRTVENIKDPLFRFFEREVNAGVRLLADVRRDMTEVKAVCQGEKKATNHHRTLMSELAKGSSIKRRVEAKHGGRQ